MIKGKVHSWVIKGMGLWHHDQGRCGDMIKGVVPVNQGRCNFKIGCNTSLGRMHI